MSEGIAWTSFSCSTTMDFDNLRRFCITIACTSIGRPITRIGDLSAIEFGLGHPAFHRARMRLGIPWYLFRRDWNRIARGMLDQRATKTARRVIRHAGHCLCTERWDGSAILITPV